jgi:hypothetical protein
MHFCRSARARHEARLPQATVDAKEQGMRRIHQIVEPVPARDIVADLRIVGDAISDVSAALGQLTADEYRRHGTAIAAKSHRRSPEQVSVQIYLKQGGRRALHDDDRDPLVDYPWWVDDAGCLHYDNGFIHVRHCPRQ